MKPAVCAICEKYPTDNFGDWVEFADYQKGSSDLSHPQGLEFFCDEHLSVARHLSDIDSAQALAKLKSAFPTAVSERKGHSSGSWWKRLLSR